MPSTILVDYQDIFMVYDSSRPHIPAEVRRDVMTNAGHRCIVQHCSEHIVEIHHIDGNRENNNISNFAVLCDKHHKLAHNNTITRKDLRRYKELLLNPSANRSQISSEHDQRLIKEINNIFSYETILIIKNEHFRKFVKQEVIDPICLFLDLSEDPLFRFNDQKLETIRQEMIARGDKFRRHFSEQSAGLVGGYQHIDINEIRRTHPEMVKYWEKYSSDTVELAHDFCDSVLKLRAELINY